MVIKTQTENDGKGHQVANSDLFTFAPKVSSKSMKIAENLGSDFMSRQQQHIEKQKRTLETCYMQYRNADPYLPKSKEKTKSENIKNQDGGSSKPFVPSPPKSPKPQTSDDQESSEGEEDPDSNNNRLRLSRMKTMPPLQSSNTARSQVSARKLSMIPAKIDPSLERIRNAKTTAEKAMKYRKIFTIQGPYRAIRESLRSRGWVEKFYKLHMSRPKRSPRPRRKKVSTIVSENNGDATPANAGGVVKDMDDDQDIDSDDDDDPDIDVDDDDPNDGCKVPPWEEENGTYGIMSRMVRNCTPTFIWSVRRDAIDTRNMRDDQVINHYGKATFTTKVGLCLNMRKVPWFEPVDPDTFFPRCYRLSHDEEKLAFIDDYRLTMCMNIMKIAVDLCERPPTADEKRPSTRGKRGSPGKARRKKGGIVPVIALEIAIEQVKQYLRFRNHDDLDLPDDNWGLTDDQWEDLLKWYYQLAHDEAKMPDAHAKLEETKAMIQTVKTKWPQFELDGTHNVWIVKPGAKSRGRGIMCYDKLEDMLRLVSSTVVKKESKFVVQKYIEKPLLVYNTKFDIRQWFLVTDWNPLTIYFYKACYLRFCSQEYTLNNFDEAIHLSNNAIQGKKVNGPRSSLLPDDNMWTHEDFKKFLTGRGAGDVWDEVVYPGMKQAINAALLCTQDIVEYRKSAFELYGADFMMTEDYKPWLIEINSSPSMSASTKITAKLCHEVLQDTIKVVLDRRYDRNCDIGQFELSYKQSTVTVPPYIGMTLVVEGQNVKKPSWMRKSCDETVAKLRMTEGSSSQTSFYDSAKLAPKTSASAEFKTSSRLAPLHIRQSTSLTGKLESSCTGLKVTPASSTSSVKESPSKSEKEVPMRPRSASHITKRISAQPSTIYKLAREQMEQMRLAQIKNKPTQKMSYLNSLKKGDAKIEDLDKPKNKPIVNNLIQTYPPMRQNLAPSPIPIEFGTNQEQAKQSVGFQSKTTVRASLNNSNEKEAKSQENGESDENDMNVTQSVDRRPSYDEKLTGNEHAFSSTLSFITPSISGKRCRRCGTGFKVRYSRDNKIQKCQCQMDSVYPMYELHWESARSSRRNTTFAPPWPEEHYHPSCHNTYEEADSELELDTSPFPLRQEDEEVEQSNNRKLPKVINIDNEKLLTSVRGKAIRAQTKACIGTNISARRKLLRYKDAHIQKPDYFPTWFAGGSSMDCSYSRRLSSSYEDNYSKAVRGFPRLLSKFKLNTYIPKDTTHATFCLEENPKGSRPKLTICPPKFVR